MEEKQDVSGSIPTTDASTDPEPARECCICMRTDQKLLHLCLVNGGDNNLFSLLCNDQDESSEGNKEPTRLIICWECDAIMSKIVRFRQQACRAQKRLSSIAEGRSMMAQNPFGPVLLPPTTGARNAGPEAILEYRAQMQNDLAHPVLRVVRYGSRLRWSLSSVLPDGSAAALPAPLEGSGVSSLLELLEGIHRQFKNQQQTPHTPSKSLEMELIFQALETFIKVPSTSRRSVKSPSLSQELLN